MIAPEQKSARRQGLLISAALVFLILLAYEPVRHNAFVEFDDNQYLMENGHIRSGLTADAVRWAFTSGYASNWHPLTWISHAVDVQLFGLNPLGHHLHNVLLHALATVLLFLFLRGVTGAVWRSAFVAMLFGLHPLHVESVAWAAERKDVLSAVFWMLTIWAYTRHAEKQRSRVERRGSSAETNQVLDSGLWTLDYCLVALCFALGLMAKPMLVSLPLVLLILDFWPLGRMRAFPWPRWEGSLTSEPYQTVAVIPPLPGGEGRGEGECKSTPHNFGAVSLRRLLAEKIPLFILASASCGITFLVQQHGKSMSPDLALPFRVANALTSYVAYLGKLFWPVNLAVLYPYPTRWPLAKPAAAAVILVLLSAWARSRASTKPYLAAGWLWYLISLLPVIGIVQVGAQSMADRYTYLPSIGIFIMVAWGAAALSTGWRHQRKILALASGLIAVALVAATRAQLGCWKDSVTLFARAVAVTENNHTMHHSLGWALAKENRLDEAAVQLEKSLQLRPDLETALDLADVLIKRKQFAEAQVHLHRILQAQPDSSLAHYDQGVICQACGQFDEAIHAYEQAVRLDTNNARAFNNLGILKSQQGRFDEAAESFRQSLRSAPDKAATHRNLAAILQMQGRSEEAVAHCRTALRLDPNDAESSWHLGYALHVSGRLREAAEYDRYTLRLQPDHVRALNDLAWILATAPEAKIRNPAEAVSLAQKACALTAFTDPELLDTLAVAQASARQFKDAEAVAQKAMTLAQAAGQEDLVRDIGKRLQGYQASQPYLEPPPAAAP